MKKKILLKLTVITLLCVCLPFVSLAHSGRTDSAGGHKDNKNASGLGYYHYHCGGFPAHLHSNGVCPYKSSTTSVPASTSSTNKSVSTASTTQYTKPTYPVVVNGSNLNITTSNYYPVVINDVTYVPLSSEVIQALNLQGGWVDSKTGIVLNSN